MWVVWNFLPSNETNLIFHILIQEFDGTNLQNKHIISEKIDFF